MPALLFGLGAGAAPAVPACDDTLARSPDDLSFRGYPIDVCGNCWQRDIAQIPPDLATPDLAMPDLGMPDLPPAQDLPGPIDAAPTDASPTDAIAKD